MAEALAGGHDCVITIGGIQSNHCRATSTAARLLGLQPHLILRTTSHGASDEDPGLVGNLLVERLQGAHVHLVRGRRRMQPLAAAATERVLNASAHVA